ncbi:MAG: sialidase family protein [bacterium]
MGGFRDFRYPVLILILVFLDITLVLWSCKGRSSMDPSVPIVPSEKPEKYDKDSDNLPILVNTTDDGLIISGTGALGLYEVNIQSQPATGEVVPVRIGSAIGDPYLVDITGFLQGSPCQDCFKMSGIEYTTDEKLIATFSIRHPFGLPQHNPPMPIERLDLHVFDMAGIVFMKEKVSDTTMYSEMSAHVTIGSASSTLASDNSGFWAFEDWDGYTEDYDEQVDEIYPTSATIHPYKIFSLDSTRGNVNALSANGFSDVWHPTGHNVFAQDSAFETTLAFNTPPGASVGFLIALTAAYGQSAQGRGIIPGGRGNPRYFLPEFNRKGAWRVRVDIPEETDLLGANDITSKTLVIAEVWDWQQNYGYPMSDIDPLTTRLDALRKSSKVGSVVIDIPGVNDLDVVSIPFDGHGFDSTPLVYRVAVQNDKNASEGNYYGLVGVIDEMHGSNILDYGIERDGVTSFDVANFVTYAPIHVSVIDRGAETFGTNQSMSGYGDDNGHFRLNPDASDGHNVASFYYNVYAVYSALNSLIGGGWDVYFQRSTDLGSNWQSSVKLNPNKNGNQNNATVQVNRMNGEIFVAYVDKSGSLPGAIGTDVVLVKSVDGGLTFSDPVIINSERAGTQDQITIGVGYDGMVYAAWRCQPELNGSSYVAWSTSSDGVTFKPQTDLEFAGFPVSENPVIAIDMGNQSTNAGSVYLTFVRPSLSSPDIGCLRYNEVTGFDSGSYVSNEVEGHCAKPSFAVNNHGVLFTAYIDQTRTPYAVKVARSSDRGHTWAHTEELNYHINGEDPGPPILIVRPNNNFIYLVWDDLVEMDRDIYTIRSTNGITYAQPQRINNDASGRDQDFPAASVNQFGNLFMVWRDKRLLDKGEMYFTRGGS